MSTVISTAGACVLGSPRVELTNSCLSKAEAGGRLTVGSSPTSVEATAAKAEERLEPGEIAADEIGLMTPTANKHYRKPAQVHAFLRSSVPALAPLNFGVFTQPDRKDERTARLQDTLAQRVAIFSLAPWTGCAGIDDRLSAGASVWHDSLFHLLILVRYTGARREHLCKLMILDVDGIDGIWFLRIETTETGRVKNTSAVRCIALADEVVRLGFVSYVQG